jgi:hypothetical protein
MDMYWGNGGNSGVPRPTAPVYALRKEGRIDEAYQMALKLHQENSDDDVKKALSWVLIDLCKKFLAEQDLNQAQTYFYQLATIRFDFEDEYIETIQKQIHILRPKIDLFYGQIQQVNELSKNRQEKQALDNIRSMIANDQLKEHHHDTYGWIIYRYMKAAETSAASIEIRTLLRDYMNLKNERPSILHSMILNFALNYSETHSDFNFYNFFVLWGPTNFMDADWRKGIRKDGRIYTSLAIEAIKKVLKVIKNQQNRNVDDLSWLIEAYDKAVKLYPDDEWLIKEDVLSLVLEDETFQGEVRI